MVSRNTRGQPEAEGGKIKVKQRIQVASGALHIACQVERKFAGVP